MSKQRLHTAHRFLFFVGATIIVSLLAFQVRNIFAAENSIPNCSYAHIFSPQSGSTVDGEVTIKALADGEVTKPVKVSFFANGEFIANDLEADASNGVWSTFWHSSNTSTSDVNLRAKVYFDSTSTSNNSQYPEGVCSTNTVKVTAVSASQNYKLGIIIREPALADGSKWSGPINFHRPFEIKVLESVDGQTATNVTSDSSIVWSTTIGKINSDNTKPRIDFFTGPNTGNGAIVVKATKNGETVSRKVYVSVIDSSDSQSYPSDGQLDDSTSTDTTNDEPKTIEEAVSSEPKQKFSLSDAEFEACLVNILGQDFEQRLIDGRRLTFEEIRKVKECLVVRRSVLPLNLAPVAPEKVRDLNETVKAKVNEISETVVQDQSTAIAISGTAEPNSTVVLYVFSDPLVLSTEADENGNWNYILDSPLEAGDHEVYVTVEDEGEVVRSSGFNFSVAQVAATEDNPQGLSLTLVGKQDSNTSKLLSMSFAVVVAGLVVVGSVIAIRNKRHHHPDMKPEKHGVSGKA